jgi:hypothetical protein
MREINLFTPFTVNLEPMRAHKRAPISGVHMTWGRKSVDASHIAFAASKQPKRGGKLRRRSPLLKSNSVPGQSDLEDCFPDD